MVFKFTDRLQRPGSFENALKKSKELGSEVVWLTGKPYFVVDPTTMLVYLRLDFGKENNALIESGQLVLDESSPYTVDPEAQARCDKRNKKKAKNSTRVWHDKI